MCVLGVIARSAACDEAIYHGKIATSRRTSALAMTAFGKLKYPINEKNKIFTWFNHYFNYFYLLFSMEKKCEQFCAKQNESC